MVFQFILWYGLQKSCEIGLIDPGHGDDVEKVWVWFSKSKKVVTQVKMNVHNGYFVKKRDQGLEIDNASGRPVLHIGKSSHGTYSTNCFKCDVPFWAGWGLPLPLFCCQGAGGGPVEVDLRLGCPFWDDAHDSRDRNYILSNSTAVSMRDFTPEERGRLKPGDLLPFKCTTDECDKDSNYWRSPASSSCYGVSCLKDNDCLDPERPICGGILGQPGPCGPRREYGAGCTFDFTCKSNNCFKDLLWITGTCQCVDCRGSGCGSCPAGEECYDTSPVEANKCAIVGSKLRGECFTDSKCLDLYGNEFPICEDGRCIPKKPIGESCTYNGTCDSGKCFKNGGVTGYCNAT
jgi:hypothetical protein